MAEIAVKNGNGFAVRALTWVGGIIGAILVIFFVWLATTVVDIRERVVRIEATAKALTDARERETQNVGARNASRLDRLEGERVKE